MCPVGSVVDSQSFDNCSKCLVCHSKKNFSEIEGCTKF